MERSSSGLVPPMPRLATYIKADIYRRVAESASRMDIPLSVWLRLAVQEKLEREQS